MQTEQVDLLASLGVDLAMLSHEEEKDRVVLPEIVKGRVVHIDADFLAYQVSADSTGQKTLEDMKHNAREIVRRIKSCAGAERVHLHLTPSTSNKGMRYEQAMLKEYQANRKNEEKPRYLNIIRNWLVKEFTGTLHETCEADDGMAAAQYTAIDLGRSNLSVICSKDKDLCMVTGLHLDWNYGYLNEVDVYGSLELVTVQSANSKSRKLKGWGHAFFWAQMLIGDTADSISGLPRITPEAARRLGLPKGGLCGPVAAYGLLCNIRSNHAALRLVAGLYRDYGNTVGFKNWRDGSAITWQEAFMSEARLLWMRRSVSDPLDADKWIKEISLETN